MLDKVKNALRVKTAAFDDEIQDRIDSCKGDWRFCGVNVREDAPAEGKEAAAGDPLITRAIVLYAKANFGYSEDSEKYRAAYDYLKCSLSLAGDYHALG